MSKIYDVKLTIAGILEMPDSANARQARAVIRKAFSRMQDYTAGATLIIDGYRIVSDTDEYDLQELG